LYTFVLFLFTGSKDTYAVTRRATEKGTL